MADKYSTIKQHQPLRTPSGWNKEEKTLIVQLEEIFDDIYRRFGRLKFSDLGSEMQKRLEDDEGNITEYGVDIGYIFAVVKNKDGDITDIEIVPGGIYLSGSKEIKLASGGSIVLIKPSEISMTTDGLVKLYGSSSSEIKFFDTETYSLSVSKDGIKSYESEFDHSHIANLDVDNLNAPNLMIPNIVYSTKEPDPGNNTIWLQPQTSSGTATTIDETKTVRAAAAHACSTTTSGNNYIFKYTVSLNEDFDLTNITKITFSGNMHKNGTDSSKQFTLTAKIKCSGGSDIDLGQLASGFQFQDYALSKALNNFSGSAKVATGIVYTLTNADALGHYTSFDAGTIRFEGSSSSVIDSDVCTVHFIP